MSDDDLLAIHNVGPGTLAEIHEKLAAYLANPPEPALSQLEVYPPKPEQPQSQELFLPKPLQSETIEVLSLSIRAYNCLKRANINTIGRLAVMRDDELLAIRNLSLNSIAEIRKKLTAYLADHPFSLLPQLPENSPSEPSDLQKVEVLSHSLSQL